MHHQHGRNLPLQLWPFGNADNLLLRAAGDARISPRSLLSLGLGIVARTFTGEPSVVREARRCSRAFSFWDSDLGSQRAHYRNIIFPVIGRARDLGPKLADLLGGRAGLREMRWAWTFFGRTPKKQTILRFAMIDASSVLGLFPKGLRRCPRPCWSRVLGGTDNDSSGRSRFRPSEMDGQRPPPLFFPNPGATSRRSCAN
jgi:hypothetical protein